MEYMLKKIKLRAIEAAGIKTFSSEEMLNLLKLWWVNLSQSKSLIRKFPFLNGVLYVKTVHAYVYPNTLSRPRTPEEIYDERCLIIPNIDMFTTTKNSLIRLQRILSKDIEPQKDNKVEVRSLASFLKLEYKSGNIKSYLQGGKSVIQRNILAPKVKRGLRAQILCDFHIDADVMVIPEAFAREFKIYSYKILNPTTLYSNPELTTIPDEYLHRLPENLTVLIKRDPCIHAASISTISKVAITDRDNLYVSPLTMGHKNADIDGDVYGIYIFESRYSAEEVRVFLNCKSNMSLTDESTRLCFSQMHIFYMQGNGHLLSEPFKSIYKNHKEMFEGSMERSLRVSKHLLANHFETVSSDWLEPTQKILNSVAMWVNTQLGSEMCFNFFHEVNKITLLLAKKNPRGYCMGDSLADPLFCKIVGSGAKDNIHGYLAFLDKLKSLDNTLTFVPQVTNRKRKYDKILTTIKDMAVSSKRVPEQSYKWFKLNSQWSDIDMDSKYLYHQGTPFMTKDELIIDQLVFTNDDFKTIVGEIEKNDSSETGSYGYTPTRLDLKRRLIARQLLMHHKDQLADSVSMVMSRPNIDPKWSSKVLSAIYKQLSP